MEHDEAVRLQAAEKYVLGELSPTQREEYEEHYFDCPECAFEMKAAAAFMDTSREVFKVDKKEVVERKAAPARGGWFSLLRPAIAAPAFVALLVFILYQNIATIPHERDLALQSAREAAQAKQAAAEARQVAAQASVPHMLPIFSLLGANRRGGGRPVIEARSGEPFALKVDITDSETSGSSGYLIRLQDASGAAHTLGSVSREEARNTVFVEVPAGFPGGSAQLVVTEMPRPGADPRTARVVTSIPFVVAFGTEIKQHQ